jgi:hypothetical protein
MLKIPRIMRKRPMSYMSASIPPAGKSANSIPMRSAHAPPMISMERLDTPHVVLPDGVMIPSAI